LHLFLVRLRLPPISTLFPYTTLLPIFIQVVDAQDVAVEELALVVGRERRTERLGDVAVHVPLDVRDRGACEDIRKNAEEMVDDLDRKSTRLNSSHRTISYAVFCLKKKR